MTELPVFADTNILVYAFGTDARAAPAKALLAHNCIISVQVLNEFVNTARRKMAMSFADIRNVLRLIHEICPVVLPMTVAIHERGIQIAERHQVSIYDALIIAAALEARCRTLWTEDMHHGLLVEDTLRIVNPFRA